MTLWGRLAWQVPNSFPSGQLGDPTRGPGLLVPIDDDVGDAGGGGGGDDGGGNGGSDDDGQWSLRLAH